MIWLRKSYFQRIPLIRQSLFCRFRNSKNVACINCRIYKDLIKACQSVAKLLILSCFFFRLLVVFFCLFLFLFPPAVTPPPSNRADRNSWKLLSLSNQRVIAVTVVIRCSLPQDSALTVIYQRWELLCEFLN